MHEHAFAAVAVLLAVALQGCTSERADVEEDTRTIGPLEFPIERTESRLARGEYLVQSVTLCFDCHAQVDWDAPGAPVKPGTEGGGEEFVMEGVPSPLIASNISPHEQTGAGNWSDQDFFDALTRGIGQDGRTLFPLMPYMSYRQLSDEDLASIIVYIRSIEPVENALPKTELPEPVRQALQPLPPRDPNPHSDFSDPVERGEYLANAALCPVCHTPPLPDGSPQPGMSYAGGWRMVGPWGAVNPANLTPDPSGISYYDEELFVSTLRTGKVEGARELNALMPVRFYRNMTDQDLKAIFAYLQTTPGVSHRVDNTEDVEPCERCKFAHGLGGMN